MAKRGRRKKPFKLKLRTDTVYSVGSIVFFLFGGLIIISFARQGELLGLLYTFLYQMFGWCAIFIAFLSVMSGFLLTRLSWGFTRPSILVGSLLIFLSLIGLTRSGSVGLEIWLSLQVLITGLGAAIILLGTFFVGIIVSFETSFNEIAGFFHTVWTKIYSGSNKIDFKQKTIQNSLDKRLPINLESKHGIDEKKPVEKESKTAFSQDRLHKINDPLVPSEYSVWEYPPFSLLRNEIGGKAQRGDMKKNAGTIEKTLDSFGIQAKVVDVNYGPAVTQYCLEIALGTKLSKITALSNDLALSLAAPTGQIRIEAPIPGKSLVGIEIPNISPEFVTLKQMLSSSVMKKAKSKLSVALGLNVSGEPVTADIAKMPHMLIAGATGSGKSVCINSFIASLLFRASPAEVKFIMVDPKRVELTQYNGIPHLLTPVITDPEQVVSALKWAIGEMEGRYKRFAEVGARNIEGFNEMSGFQALPYLVIIIDELADIMLFAPSEVEDSITRIAQMARATGIHLIVSTQRPSVDVLTGLIKANIPARIAFNVSSMIDSRVILDTPGAEKLLGKGDMLYIPPDQAKPTRIQGAYVSDSEINQLIDFLRNTGIKPVYTEDITTKFKSKMSSSGGINSTEERDGLFEEAIKVVCQHDRASASLLQRRLSLGYARAARILDQLEAAGIVGQAEGSKPRDVLVKSFEEFQSRQGG